MPSAHLLRIMRAVLDFRAAYPDAKAVEVRISPRLTSELMSELGVIPSCFFDEGVIGQTCGATWFQDISITDPHGFIVSESHVSL